MQKYKILVLGDDERAPLTVVRSLGRAGAQVHATWCKRDGPVAASRYCHRWHDIPAFDSDDMRWKESLISLLNREKFDLVIPCMDNTIIPLQIHIDSLPYKEKIYTLSSHAFAETFNKINTFRLAQECGVPVPETIVVRRGEAIPEEVKKWPFPLVVKPASSFDLDRPGESKRSVRRAFSHDELLHMSNELLAETDILIQRNFHGEGGGVELLAKDGMVLAMFQHRRLHEPPQGSGSSYRSSTSLHPGMADAARRLVKAIGYTGVMMIEVRWNLKNDEWRLIEINGRFWGSLPLAVAAGADFPRWLAEMWIDGRTDFPQEYRRNIYVRNWNRDWRWFVCNLKADRKNPHLQTRPLHTLPAEILNLILLREASDTFTWDDPRPAFRVLRLDVDHVLYRRVRSYGIRLTERFALLRFRTYKTALRRWFAARHILFVCKGNICRSPFAERYAASLYPAKRFRSAGFYPKDRRESPQSALIGAKNLGTDLSSHRSRTISNLDVDNADLVVVFDTENMSNMRQLFPEAAYKTIYFGELSNHGEIIVTDPYPGDVSLFMECYRRISNVIAELNTGGRA